MTFEELGVREDLLRAISEMGFESPMPVQEKVIPHLLHKDGDVVALAQTGTGKTAAFGLPVIQRIDIPNCKPQALILSPTRELCLQIGGDLADYSKYVAGLKVLPVYGGSSIESQIRSLRQGVHIVVATPGRLIDLINRGTVDLSGVHTVILDEADEMLNMGFVDDINSILDNVPEDRKMLLFSATMPNEIAKIAKNYMHNPEEFVVGTGNEGAENVRHIYYMVNARDKYLALKRIADSNPNIYAIIFCRTRRETQEIADNLIVDGYNVDSLHGDLSQQQRDTVMKKFREHTLQLLVATDVAARGLDVDSLTHVINYGLPDDIATYTHRSGRTGRAGKNGVSISIVHSREKSKIRDIERRIGKEFERKMVPTPQYIIEKQLYNLADRIEKVEVNEDEIAKYLPGILRKLEWLSGEDLLKRIVSMEFNRLLDYYKDAPNVEDYVDKKPRDGKDSKKGSGKTESRRRSDADKDSRKAERGYERIYVNAGKADGFMPARLIETINENMDGRVDIGRIDLLQNYALFDVRKGSSNKVITALKNARFFGKRLYAEVADPKRDYSKASNRKSNSKGKRYDEGDKFAKFKKDKKADDRIMKRVFALFGVMLAWASAYAGGIASVFTSDNIPLFPTLEKNSRLDMVDYFAAGKKMEVQNKMGGKSQLLECSEEYLKVKTSDSSTTEMRLTELNGDTVIAVVRKYEVPQADAVLAFYSADWKELPLEKVIKLPVMADFINAPKKLKKELAEMIEFPLMAISIAEEGKIVFEPTVMEYLSIENAEKIKQYLIDKLVYVKRAIDMSLLNNG